MLKELLPYNYKNNYKKSPIFLLGTVRSGTTLLQRIINSADDVAIWGEHGGFLIDIAKAYFMNLEDKTIVKHIPKHHKPFYTFHATVGKLKNPKLWSGWHNWYSQAEVNNNFCSLVEGFFNPSELKNNMRWGFKETRYGKGGRTLEMLSNLYPDVKFVFIIRNPVDIVAANLFKILKRSSILNDRLPICQAKELKQQESPENWESFVEKKAEEWKKQNAYFLDFKEKNSSKSLLVSYEDLITDISVAESTLKWLDVSYSKQKIKEVLEMKEGRGESIAIGGDRCRSLLTEREVDKIKNITEEVTSGIQLTLVNSEDGI